jgi:hypothetical protein
VAPSCLANLRNHNLLKSLNPFSGQALSCRPRVFASHAAISSDGGRIVALFINGVLRLVGSAETCSPESPNNDSVGTRHAFSQSPLSHAHHPFIRPVFKGSNGPLSRPYYITSRAPVRQECANSGHSTASRCSARTGPARGAKQETSRPFTQSSRSLRPAWPSGLRPNGQWNLRSASAIGRSLIEAYRRRISPAASNSQFSLP